MQYITCRNLAFLQYPDLPFLSFYHSGRNKSLKILFKQFYTSIFYTKLQPHFHIIFTHATLQHQPFRNIIIISSIHVIIISVSAYYYAMHFIHLTNAIIHSCQFLVKHCIQIIEPVHHLKTQVSLNAIIYASAKCLSFLIIRLRT